MALHGKLQDFSLVQLLNLINLAHKTGELIIEHPEDEARLFFKEGKLAYAQLSNEDCSLVGILHKTNRLSASQCQIIKKNVNGMSDKELGLLLINANYFTHKDILVSVQTYFTDVLEKLLTWVEGFFHFEAGILPPQDRITVPMSLENFILEGARRSHELEYLQEEIPTLEIAIKFVDHPGAHVKDLRLSRDEWRVIHYVDPRNTLRQIAKVTGYSENKIRRIVYSLLQAGIVELVRPMNPPRPAPLSTPIITSTLAPEQKEERKSLIKRIIDRIRSL